MTETSPTSCLNCQRLEKQIAELNVKLQDLESRLSQNSQNSSRPPSSDMYPPKRPLQKKRKKRGGQKGHKPHLKKLLPPERVNRQHVIEPKVCPDCNGEQFVESDEAALRHQFIDVPPITIDVTEFVRPVRKCTGCKAHVYAPMPEGVSKSCFGSGALSLVAILTGVLNVSKRKALLIMNEVFDVPMSLGGLSNCESQIADALDTPYTEALAHIRHQDVAHADETGWRRGNRKKGWLWTLCGTTAAVFRVHAKRSQLAAKELLACFSGILVTDRWNGYNFFSDVRQICWAHLKRDFNAVSEDSGQLGKIGEKLHSLSTHILRLRARVQDGTLKWSTFQNRMPPLITEVESLLKKGAMYEGGLGGKCRDIVKHRKNLWTFVEHIKVNPTNNHAERMVRQGVLWRKSSFGTQSKRGARYVERVLTAGATCRLQDRSIIEFMREACLFHLQKTKPPSLIR